MNLKSAARALGGEVRGNRVYAPGPGHSAADRSMWVAFDWQAPNGFVVGSFSGDPFDACRDHVRARLGMEPWAPKGDRAAQQIPHPKKPTTVTAIQDFKNRARLALDIWNEAKSIERTAGEIYLIRRIGRAIDWPADLRFHPRCARKTAAGLEHHSAVVALLRDIDSDEPRAIQRIFIKPDGSDRLRDSQAKMTLGPSVSGVVKLSPDADVTSGLGIVEGVEKGLALLAAGWAPIWATCGTSGLSGFPVLDGPELTIFADNDAPGLEAAARCSQRWVNAGRHARVVAPKTPNFDWDDELRAAA